MMLDLLPGSSIFPISANTKRPQFAGWQKAATSDPVQIAAWSSAYPGCAWAIACAESGLIGVEVDPKARRSVKDKESEQVGHERANAAWDDLCASWGFQTPLVPHVRSRSGGAHTYFRAPAGVDAKALIQRGLIKLPGFQQFVIESRVNGFLLIPPSEFEGLAYTRWPGGPSEPYAAPPLLIEALLRREGQPGDAPVGVIKPGSYDLAPLVKYIAKLNHNVGLTHDVWRATIFGFVAQYGRTVAHQVFHHICDGSPETVFQINDLIGRAREDFKPGDATLSSLFRYGHENGISDIVPMTSSAMFGMPPLPLNVDAILVEIDRESVSALPLVSGAPSLVPVTLTGRGSRQAELWAPLLANVPHVERTPAHPLMPDIGHPLREAINAAIPGIMATGEVQALAVVEATHPQTAGIVGVVTNTVKARAEALRSDAEHTDTPADFTRSFKGQIEGDNPDNLLFFMRSLDIDVRWNAWNDRVELRGWKWPEWTEISDGVVARLRKRAGQTGTRYTVSKDFVWDMLLAFSFENTVDPALDKLDQLQAAWDGHSRLNSWLSHACGVPYDDYHQAVGASILLGLVARIRQPGIKFELVPVLVSEAQGTSKSTLARMLALEDDWFSEAVKLGDEAKELVLKLAGKSVVEIAEMRTKGDVDAVKAMISTTHDEGRPAYGRGVVRRGRRNIFIGTTNRPEFLEDVTGGRRFLPITVNGEIDLDFVRTHLPQLVGEAASLHSRGADINIPRTVWAAATAHQVAATTQSSAEVLLTDWFGGGEPCWISPANLVLLLRQALGREVSRGVYADVMRKIGFVSKPCRVGPDDESIRVWVRGEIGKGQAGYGPQLSLLGRPTRQMVHPQTPVTLMPPGLVKSVT